MFDQPNRLQYCDLDNENKQYLSPQDTRLALNFIRNKFPKSGIKKSVLRLNRYHRERQFLRGSNKNSAQEGKIVFDVHPSSTAHNSDKQAHQNKIIKIENSRLIARLFCEGGADITAVRQFIPNITPQIYRSKLNSIINSVVKDLLTMLKQHCQIQVKKLTECQKILIIAALREAHSWMALNHLKGFQVFLKMISRRYLRRGVVVLKEQLKELYSVIARRINDKYIDIQDEKEQAGLGEAIQQLRIQRLNMKKLRMAETLTSRDQHQICSVYGSCLDIQKTISYFINKYGFGCKWQRSTIEQVIINKIEHSLQKIVSLYAKNSPSEEALPISSQTALQIYESLENSLKGSLVNLNLAKKIKKTEYEQLINLLKSFLSVDNYRQQKNSVQKQISKTDSKDILYFEDIQSLQSIDVNQQNQAKEPIQDKDQAEKAMNY